MTENWRIDSLSKTAFKAVVESDQNLMELEYVPAGSQSDATINWAIRPRGVPRGGRVFCSIVWRTFLCPLHVCLFGFPVSLWTLSISVVFVSLLVSSVFTALFPRHSRWQYICTHLCPTMKNQQQTSGCYKRH